MASAARFLVAVVVACALLASNNCHAARHLADTATAPAIDGQMGGPARHGTGTTRHGTVRARPV
jgi:hypothetical protein